MGWVIDILWLTVLMFGSLLILLMAASLFLPYQNRVFLVALPVFLMFEHHIAAMLGRFRKRKPAT